MMAEIDEEYDISDAVTSLGKLLRYSMKVGIRQCPGGAGTGIYQELYGVNQSAV